MTIAGFGKGDSLSSEGCLDGIVHVYASPAESNPSKGTDHWH